MLKDRQKFCIKMFIIFGIVILFFTPSISSNHVTNSYDAIESKIMQFNYLDEDELIISFHLNDLIKGEIKTDHGVFDTFSIPNSGFLGLSGKPQLPIFSTIIAVPNQEFTFIIEDFEIDQSFFVNRIYPAQLPNKDNEEKISQFIIDEEFYQTDLDYPGKFVEIVESGKIRDIDFVKIEFYPVQYNPKQNIVTIYDEISFKLSFNVNDHIIVEKDFNSSPFSSLYRNVFSNWQVYLDNTNLVESTTDNNPIFEDDGCEFLIITDPSFVTQANDLALWKNSKGIITRVVDTDETGSSSSNLKQYIKSAYDSWEPRPSYILLFGDSEFIPTSQSGTDLYYVTVEGSDYFPDLYLGRIPADSSQEADVIVQKILNYEQNPPRSTDFYNNFAVAAYFQDDEGNGYESRRFVRTSEEIRDFLLSRDFNGERIYCTEPYIDPTHYNNGDYGDGEPLPEELLRPVFAWEGNADDIINAIENGIFILNHRDHGFADGWGDPYFDSNHVHDLTNGDLLPVVFSINCESGRFDGYESFCEEFVRQEGGGAIAAFGASRVSYSGYNDYLCLGFYDSQWPDFDPEVGSDEPMYKLGQILNYGKFYMSETWGDPWGIEKTTFELFHCFGDPTLEIWTSVPKEIELESKFDGENLELTITDGVSEIEGALVCLKQESGFYTRGYTDSSGMIIIDTSSANIEEEVSIVISAHNCLTYIDTFVLNQPPLIPDKPQGPEAGIINRELTYSISTTDPDEDQIFYKWCWGDGHFSEWFGPFDSGETVSASHKWSTEATYFIKVKAKDIYDQETEWSEKFNLKISESRVLNFRFSSILEILLKDFPVFRLFNLF